MSDHSDYWFELADYDIETAKAMLSSKRYLYVGFMCHQTIEKALKAVIARSCVEGEFPPKIHDLSRLAVLADIIHAMSEEQQDFIETLNPLSIQARYPAYKDKLYTTLTHEKCQELVDSTEELLCWIKTQ
jgi:HEPN domain-containing protein